jgi:Bacterial Ig-like domain (group 2)
MRPLKYVATCIALGAGISCGRDSTGPLAVQIGAVTIVNPPAALDLHFTAQLSATVYSKDGSPVSGIPIHWWTNEPMMLVIESGDGSSVLIAAAQLGEATLYAQAGALIDSVRITIRPASVASIKVAPASPLLGLGRSVQISVRSLDAHGAQLVDRQPTFTSSKPDVVDVSGLGIMTAASVGSATVTVTVESVSTTIPVSVVDATPVNITLNILNPFANAVAADLTATLRGIGDSLVTPQFGTVNQATITGSLGLPPFVDVVIGSVTNQHTQPAVGHYAATGLPLSVSMIAVPTSFDIAKAFVPVCTDFSSQDCQSFYPLYFKTGVKAWLPSSLPIPVMFDRSRSNLVITPADSVLLWKTLRDFEATMGQTFFAPATMTGPSDAGYVVGAITVAIDNTITYAGGQANWYWNARDEIQAGKISFKAESELLNGPVAKHEFLHTLGLHHTCQWPSVMGGYGCPMDDLTQQDVAYAKAAWYVRDAELPLRTTAGDLPPSVLSLSAIAEGEALRGEFSNLAAFSAAARNVRGKLAALRLPGYAGEDSAH